MSYRKDLFRQKQCATCKGFFYEDDLQQDDSGRLLCHHCYINSLTPKRGFASRVNIEIARGMHLLEMLIVIAIVGVMVGVAVPNIVKLRRNAANKALLNVYYENQGTGVADLAEQFITAYEGGQPLDEIVEELPELSDISDEEFNKLEKELSDCVGMEVEELKLGKAMQAILGLQWYKDQIEQIENYSY